MTNLLFDVNVRHMKTVTTREFYHNPSLVEQLPSGDSLRVTSRGKPSFSVTKLGKPVNKMSLKMIKERSVATGAPMDGVEFLRELRK